MKHTNFYTTALWSTVLLVTAAVFVPTDVSAQMRKNKSWRQVLQEENRRVDNKGGSIFGIAVGPQVRRIQNHHKISRRIQEAFAGMPKGKAAKAKANYNRLQAQLTKNPLFKGYILVPLWEASLYEMDATDFQHFLAFCGGFVNPSSARQYKKDLELDLRFSASSSGKYIEVYVYPEAKVIEFNERTSDFYDEGGGDRRSFYSLNNN